MQNSFFKTPYTKESLSIRLSEIDQGKVGFYSVGLYPASLAYNCAMQGEVKNLLLAPRSDRELLGAFSKESIDRMDPETLNKIKGISTHIEGDRLVKNTLPYLLEKCEIIILSANSKHIENDLLEACELRKKLNREQVLIACLVGSFCFDKCLEKSYVLCERVSNLAFYSGFHRHGALLNPFDSFTANFCHPDGLTAMLGAKMMDKLSPNIQVSGGIHNLEGQYIKAAKNISSIFAGFGYSFHQDNPGLLPTLLTLLLNQCLDQAATVSMSRHNRNKFYDNQIFPITELGYGVQQIEASLLKGQDRFQVRDHTFAQLTAMVADVRGSMMLPGSGQPTRNFQAGQILGQKMNELKRCPKDVEELISWCNDSGLKKGGLEGVNSLIHWPHIKNNYSIPFHDSSMINLLYMCIMGSSDVKEIVYKVMTQSRQLTSFCQESVRPSHSRKYAEAVSNLDRKESAQLIIDSLMSTENNMHFEFNNYTYQHENEYSQSHYLKLMNIIESEL
tara:strand:+ start:7662 stop:9173 length:1512 start_codon:yes stop_codon:yes gene_type:complete